MSERTLDELANDPAVARALQRIGHRTPHDPCPRCGEAPIAANSKHGFCQPCDTAQEERIKASRRRSYHRRKQIPTDPYGQHRTQPDDDGVLVGEEGWRLLTVTQTADKLGVARSTVYEMIRDGRLRSLKLGGKIRRIPADALMDLVDQAENQEPDDGQ